MAEDTTKVYALDEGKNQHETMTREQIVTAIENMEATGSVGDVDDGFISKIKELNENGLLRFWVGTMAEFNKLEMTDPGVLYLFTDDPTVDDLEEGIDANATNLNAYKSENAQQLLQLQTSLQGKIDDLEAALRRSQEAGSFSNPALANKQPVEVAFETATFGLSAPAGSIVEISFTDDLLGRGNYWTAAAPARSITAAKAIYAQVIVSKSSQLHAEGITITATGDHSLSIFAQPNEVTYYLVSVVVRTPYSGD